MSWFAQKNGHISSQKNGEHPIFGSLPSRFFFRNLWTWPYFAHLKYVKGQTPYRSVLDFWRNNLKKSSSINWIFSLFWTRFLLCVAWKNQFQNWFLQDINPVCQTWFLQLDFPKIRYRSTAGKVYLAQSSKHWRFFAPKGLLVIIILSKVCRLHNRDSSRFFDQVGHQTTNSSIGNKYFFTE